MSSPKLPHLAQLAALELTADEAASLAVELEAIVGYVEQLGAVPTDGVPPMTSVAPGRARRIPLRDDEPKDGLSHQDALASASATAEGGFSVPTFVGS